MEHLLLKAVATTTDQGIFEAVISSEAVDREQDIVVAAAMVDALRAWAGTNKNVPLHWNHSSEPEDIVGHVDPFTVREVDGEVVAGGWVDRDIDRGREVWRLMKSGTLGFSFGYIITASTERNGGGREITGLDVYEITATTAPMNNGTRVLSTKALDELDHVRTKARDDMFALLTAADKGEKSVPRRAIDPVEIATFEC
jgi:HK97 family phage prohead protease